MIKINVFGAVKDQIIGDLIANLVIVIIIINVMMVSMEPDHVIVKRDGKVFTVINVK